MKLILALLVAATPALSQPATGGQTTGGKTTECYCTDRNGARIEMGGMICLQVDGRMFMAQCQMSLNVPMWREMSDGCLSSRLSPSRLSPGLLQTPQPVVDAGGVDAQI